MGVQEIYFASPVGNIAGALSSAIVGGGVQLYARCRGDGLPGEYLRVADQQNDEYYFNNIYLPSTCKIGIIFQSLGGAILLSHTILVDQNTDKIEFNIGSGDLASAAADPHPPF
ncbi:MAG TPA: hypothetical protein VMS32_01660 [Verrucomicrobiae bacterium]|nr:hypothetical protein [Verrucomicrobiae bacterium]